AGIRQEHLCGATLDEDRQKLRLRQVIPRLCSQHHRGVSFPPRLHRLQNVGPNGRVSKEPPSLIHDEEFEGGSDRGIVDCSVRAMQDVKKERFEYLRIFVHALEVKGLEPSEAERV